MEMKAENTQRIKELEAEFSDEKIAEIFSVDDVDEMDVRGARRRMTRKAALRGAFIAAFAALCAAVALQFFSFEIMRDGSMAGTIDNNDCVIVAKRAYSSSGARLGDVIAHDSFSSGENAGGLSRISRVVGLPGDEIEIREGIVYRNGEILDEPYITDAGADLAPVLFSAPAVPAGCYFVLGDNRGFSIESLDVNPGFVPQDDIRGKVVFRVLPVSRAGGVS